MRLAQTSRTLAIISGALALVAAALYVALIAAADDPVENYGIVAAVVAAIAGAGFAALAGGLAASPRTASRLLGLAGAVLVIVGVLAIFSIGLALIVAGGLALAAAAGQLERDRWRYE